MSKDPATIQEEQGVAEAREALRSASKILKLCFIVFFILYLGSGIVIIKEHEQAVILRFGQLLSKDGEVVRNEGYHFAWPYPIDEVVRFSAKRQFTVESQYHWRAPQSPGDTTEGLNPEVEGHVLASDLNILQTQWSLRYEISDFAAFFNSFKDADPRSNHEQVDAFMRSLLANSVIKACSKIKAEEALTHKRVWLSSEVERHIQRELLNWKQPTGLTCLGVQLLTVTPPRAVEPHFAKVLQAATDKETDIEKAKAYAFKTQQEALGRAQKLLAEARSRSDRRIKEARADSQYIQSIVHQYKDHPEGMEVFKEQLRLETIQKALEKVEEKYVLHGKGKADQKREIRYRLFRDPAIQRELELEARGKSNE